MVFNNIFRRATKEYSFELTNATGNVALVNTVGYSKAVVVCSTSGRFRPSGYIDSNKESPTIKPIVVELNGKISRDEERQNFIVDVSCLSWMFINLGSSYTGSIFITLSQDEVRIDNIGITSFINFYKTAFKIYIAINSVNVRNVFYCRIC